ncbi:uncharacterized protein RJT20DRAFT_22759 [Scheffersomyces xylosifermentans]|uniref:uncharacterized protein n=1 Tax=Scheffersomyces xylosifermentans TaxID=1304137 RepID=UPI00315DFB2E
MNTIEVVASEDLGFKLDSDEKGITIFKEGIDFTGLKEPLNLLTIGNKNRYIAVSNVYSLKLDTIEGLNRVVEASKSDLSDLDNPFVDLREVYGEYSLQQIFFNADESKLYLVNNSRLQYLDTIEYFESQTNVISYHEGFTGVVKSIRPSPTDVDQLLVLDDSKTLWRVQKNGKQHVASNIAAYSWAPDGSSFSYIAEKSSTITNSKEGKINIETAEDEDFESDQYEISALYDLNSKWVAVYESNESELDDHIVLTYIVSKKDGIFTTEKLELEPPSNTIPRNLTFYFAHLSQWMPKSSVYFFASGSSTDIDTVLSQGQTTEIILCEDTNRASFPIDDDADVDTSPVGMALDLTGFKAVVKEPCSGVEEVVGKLPKLYTLLHTGKLICWWFFNKHAIIEDTISLKNAYAESTTIKISDFDNEQPNSKEAEINKETESLNKSSPFGQAAFGSKPSVLSGSSENPFGSSTSDPFSKIKDTKTTTDSPFGAKTGDATTKSSPFGGFGSSGFGGSASTAPGNAFATPSNAFSNITSSSADKKESAFGSSAFGASSTTKTSSGFGATGFGNTGFGSTGFGSMTSKPSDAAKSATSSQPSSFGNYASASASFGSSTKSQASPFGAVGVSSSDSPFSSLGQKSESPFGSLGTFGDSNKQSTLSSPFGKLSNSTVAGSSPFANLSESSNSTAFSGISSKTDKPSPFGSIKSERTLESPFETLKKDNEPVSRSPLTNSAPSTKIETPNATKPLFGGSSTLSKAPVIGGFQETRKASPFSSFKADFSSTIDSSRTDLHQPASAVSSTADASESERSDLSSEEEEEDDEEVDADEEGGSDYKSDVNLNFTKASIDSTNDAAKSADRFMVEAESYDEHVPDKQTFNNEANKLNEFILSRPATEVEQDSSDDYVQPVRSEFSDESEFEVIPEEVVEEEELDKQQQLQQQFDNLKPPQIPDILKYDGINFSGTYSEDAITNKILEIINRTAGQLKVLEMNTNSIISFIDGHSNVVNYPETALEHPEKWTLGSIHNLFRFISEVDDRLNSYIEIVSEQEEISQDLLGSIQESQQNKIQLDKLFSQLAVFNNTHEDSLLKRRPLDLANETLQTSLRTKLRKIKTLEQELLSLLMPLKARASIDDSVVKNLEKVAYQIHNSVTDHTMNVKQLTSAVNTLSLDESSSVVPLPVGARSAISAKITNKWSLAEQFATPKRPHIIKLS